MKTLFEEEGHAISHVVETLLNLNFFPDHEIKVKGRQENARVRI